MKTILVDAVFCLIIEDGKKFKIYDDMHELLDKYPNEKLILTGATEDKFEFYCLNKIPYKHFTLRHNPEKTNPQYYAKMLENFNLKADEVIYFEHNSDAVQSARSVGISTYYYDNDKKDLVSLKNFLDKNL